MEYHIEEEESIDLNLLIFKKKKLIEQCKNLSNQEYVEIFNIIIKDSCQYSKNKNGIFINLSNVTENTIDKILNFISYIKYNKEDLLKHEEVINNVKKNISIEDKVIQNTYNINNNEEYDNDSDEDDDNYEYNNLIFSSDEEEDLENKLNLKKKKIKYSGKKAKMIKSIRDSNDMNKNKIRNKKIEE